MHVHAAHGVVFILPACCWGRWCATAARQLLGGLLKRGVPCPAAPLQLRAELERQAAEKGVKLNLPPLPGDSSSSSGGSGSGGEQQR